MNTTLIFLLLVSAFIGAGYSLMMLTYRVNLLETQLHNLRAAFIRELRELQSED